MVKDEKAFPGERRKGVILSGGQSPESKGLGSFLLYILLAPKAQVTVYKLSVRRSFDSLRSLRMTTF